MDATYRACFPTSFKSFLGIRGCKENSVDPDQVASDRSQLIWIYTVFKKQI